MPLKINILDEITFILFSDLLSSITYFSFKTMAEKRRELPEFEPENRWHRGAVSYPKSTVHRVINDYNTSLLQEAEDRQNSRKTIESRLMESPLKSPQRKFTTVHWKPSA